MNKVILVDLNQVMLSNMFAQLGNHTNVIVDEDMLRHMILNSLRSFKVKFGQQYGELVICCDGYNVWRKKVFPHYKANRKKLLEKSELDWKSIFQSLTKIKEELKEYFPYRVIDVESAEADDVIETLVTEFGSVLNTGTPILILSGDKDFIQLHVNGNVKQYNPTMKKWITHDDPESFLTEHIIKGDVGDGIPNVLSADDCFVTGTRQKTISQKKLESLMEDIPFEVLRNFQRNQELIDLSNTPPEIREKVLEQYNSQDGRNKSKLMNYFITNKLRNLMENIGEF